LILYPYRRQLPVYVAFLPFHADHESEKGMASRAHLRITNTVESFIPAYRGGIRQVSHLSLHP
jgi:hypothetical protein